MIMQSKLCLGHLRSYLSATIGSITWLGGRSRLQNTILGVAISIGLGATAWWVWERYGGSPYIVFVLAASIVILLFFMAAFSRLATRIFQNAKDWPLLASVTAAVLTGLMLVFIGYGAIIYTLQAKEAAPPTRIDVLRTALTTVAGVGGAVALVVAYRRQRDLEQGRFVETFGAAVAQLGNSDPAVRIAGAYALSAVADESRDFIRRQQCIDVLCGYVRLPYSPEYGNNHLTELVTTITRDGFDQDVGASTTEESHRSLRVNDQEVRRTIFEIIANHLRMGSSTSWSDHDINLQRAIIEDVQFEKLQFNAAANFDETLFLGRKVRFNSSVFRSGCTFELAKFECPTYFFDTEFLGRGASFRSAVFSSHVSFSSAKIKNDRYIDFIGTRFGGKMAVFQGVKFDASSIMFDECEFSGNADFRNSTFEGGHVGFSGAAFRGGGTFQGAKFLADIVDFSSPIQWGEIVFDWKEDPPVNVRPAEWPPVVMSTGSVQRRRTIKNSGA